MLSTPAGASYGPDREHGEALHDGYVSVAEGSDASIRTAFSEVTAADNGGIASSSSEISRNSAAFSTAWFLCMFSGRSSVVVRGHQRP
jgi:hypothetical protein